MARSVDPPWWWKPWLAPYYRVIEWWERPRPVKLAWEAEHVSDDDREHLSRLIHGELDLCGCGNPEDAYNLIRDILALAPFYDHPQKVRDLIGNAGAHHIVLSLLNHARLIEHGGGIGGSWITPKGKHYLGLMQRYEYDDLDEAGLPHEGGDCPPQCPHRLTA